MKRPREVFEEAHMYITYTYFHPTYRYCTYVSTTDKKIGTFKDNHVGTLINNQLHSTTYEYMTQSIQSGFFVRKQSLKWNGFVLAEHIN